MTYEHTKTKKKQVNMIEFSKGRYFTVNNINEGG